jgi:hypothetical protein
MLSKSQSEGRAALELKRLMAQALGRSGWSREGLEAVAEALLAVERQEDAEGALKAVRDAAPGAPGLRLQIIGAVAALDWRGAVRECDADAALRRVVAQTVAWSPSFNGEEILALRAFAKSGRA